MLSIGWLDNAAKAIMFFSDAKIRLADGCREILTKQSHLTKSASLSGLSSRR